jgi:putative SOS response-associated peptidase YedK
MIVRGVICLLLLLIPGSAYSGDLAAGGYPVTNIRNTSSPHWRAWLKPENRCLVPANSFAEYAPEPNPETKKKESCGSRSMRTAAVRVRWHRD